MNPDPESESESESEPEPEPEPEPELELELDGKKKGDAHRRRLLSFRVKTAAVQAAVFTSSFTGTSTPFMSTILIS